MEWHHDGYCLTDDRARVDLDAVYALLQTTYWAARRTREIIAKSVRHSLNFSLTRDGVLVGFARVATDYATHGYLCDVVIAEEHRGKGLGTWMVGRVLEHPYLNGCRIDLFTRDAQEFYRSLGFGTHKDECMVRYPPGYAGGSEAAPKR